MLLSSTISMLETNEDELPAQHKETVMLPHALRAANGKLLIDHVGALACLCAEMA